MLVDSPTSVTQIIYLTIPPAIDLKDTSTDAGRRWSNALDLLERELGYQRLYWGRSPPSEEPEKVQLHVVRDHLSQHLNFLNGPSYLAFKQALRPLTGDQEPMTRHATLTYQTPNSRALNQNGGAPYSGSAIYVSTDESWHEGAWPLWTHIVRYVDGCLGTSGGSVVEKVDGHSNCYIVYVGWESIEKHDAYHHTKHFAKHRIILGKGNKGWREYGHISFEGGRDKFGPKI